MLWGPRRVALGISLTELSHRTGISKPDLSRMEKGRIFPTPDEYQRVMEALK